jgi:Tfp pilus assembly protein PilO
MKKELSKREKSMLIFLAVLLVGLLYYKFFLTPINDRVTDYTSDTANDQSMLDSEMPRMTKLNQMKKELAELEKSADSKPIPDYDNSRKVMDELHSVLSGAVSYTLSFNSTSESNSIVSRPINMDFQTADYAAARAIIDRLHDGAYTNQISDLTFSTDKDGNVQTDLTITYYELKN